jgi:hypothetical protein
MITSPNYIKNCSKRKSEVCTLEIFYICIITCSNFIFIYIFLMYTEMIHLAYFIEW